MGELVNSPISYGPVDGSPPASSEITPASFSAQAEAILAVHRENPLGGDGATAMARILTVDPNEGWRDSYERHGTASGHEVIGVATILEAIPLLQAGGFDMVITSKHDGRWPKVHALAEEIGARTVLISGEAGPTLSGGHAEEGAKRRELTYLNKGETTYSELQALFDSLNKPAQDEAEASDFDPNEFCSGLSGAQLLALDLYELISSMEAHRGYAYYASLRTVDITESMRSGNIPVLKDPFSKKSIKKYGEAFLEMSERDAERGKIIREFLVGCGYSLILGGKYEITSKSNHGGAPYTFTEKEEIDGESIKQGVKALRLSTGNNVFSDEEIMNKLNTLPSEVMDVVHRNLQPSED